MPRVYSKRPAIERFSALYLPEPNSGCWLWTGAESRGRPMFNAVPYSLWVFAVGSRANVASKRGVL